MDSEDLDELDRAIISALQGDARRTTDLDEIAVVADRGPFDPSGSPSEAAKDA
jgi:DNA-binding Lrp family transcriptional regulator